LIPLSWVLASAETNPAVSTATAQSVNEVCLEMLHSRAKPSASPRGPDKLRKKLATLIARGHDESTRLEAARKRAADADHLRDAGDMIYAHLAEIATGAQRFEAEDGRSVALDPLLTAKENAAEYFHQYKKARSGLPRIEARLRTLQFSREYWDQLLWELERAEQLDPVEREVVLGEIADALGFKKQRERARRQRTQERRVALSDGAFALVGRSPKENERLTFSIAGPNDYWFHARGIPGAHVIVKTGGPEISPQQIEEAAGLAAAHSRAADSAHVEIDYTQRKHVRRHSSGRPGLVWYTDFQTVRVRPDRSRNIASPNE
jgi:predicted ribosome quality control (RQC) complex YloA/Tae2 family protein